MKKAELIFIPSPGVGHLASAIQAAKLLLNRDDRISITVLVFKGSSGSNPTTYAYDPTTTPRLCLVNLPMVESKTFTLNFMEPQIPQVRQAVFDLFPTSSSSPLVGFVLDMFCTSMIDVAKEFGVPSYIYFASNAVFLGFLFHLQLLHDEHQIDLGDQAKDSEAELKLPVFTKQFPARNLPIVVREKYMFSSLLNHTRRFREAKGILVNSFTELETHALDSLSRGNNPPVYPVGPILNLGSEESSSGRDEIMHWLDDQPSSSVVFLCFGSRGALSDEQVKEIACALEHSKHRFLWSLRSPPPKERGMKGYTPTEYENFEEVLPVGFLDRTVGIGKIIGWAPQTAILGHSAIGGFVSHCGWNSTLESLWFGVPIAVWPLDAEQQLNAFELVKELELAAEIQMGYIKDSGVIVTGEEIERGIRSVMEQDSKIRKNVKEMSEKSKMVSVEGGSSYAALNRFIEDVMDNESK
ncbi:UDP-Glycosyltransferase superfamily protein [Euphorbia peplus]|nr:UDP-Glycosyltransferase superfamily protein [Euphorbia peplus]